MLRLLTDDARRLTQGRPALADTEPELADCPARLTVTFGFGPGLFAAAEGGRRPVGRRCRRSGSTSCEKGGAAGTCCCRSAPTTRSPSPTPCG